MKRNQSLMMEPVRLVVLIGEAEGEVIDLLGKIGYVQGERDGRVKVWFPSAGKTPFEFAPEELEAVSE